MKPKIIFIMVLYMILVYTTVHVFTTATCDTFVVGGEHTNLLEKGNQGGDVDPDESVSAYQNMSWLDSIGAFFGSIVDAFSYIIGLLTFNIVGSSLSDGSTVPAVLSFVPLLMVLPVWIAVIYWIAPYAIKAIQAIGNWIPFT